jgi:hypothetical protein
MGLALWPFAFVVSHDISVQRADRVQRVGRGHNCRRGFGRAARVSILPRALLMGLTALARASSATRVQAAARPQAQPRASWRSARRGPTRIFTSRSDSPPDSPPAGTWPRRESISARAFMRTISPVRDLREPKGDSRLWRVSEAIVVAVLQGHALRVGQTIAHTARLPSTILGCRAPFIDVPHYVPRHPSLVPPRQPDAGHGLARS